MRPLHLTMAAFGPFAGVESISFETLGENPLFLINGPTGSGKTTILDGICFALYGKTTGAEREAAQMRCDIARPGQLTYVELLFKLAGKTWRIRREPEQQRAKSRGDGSMTHQPRAELYCRADDGTESVVVAAKVSEVRQAIEEMMGLNVDQFRQVMVLPQGEFRKLLVAKSSEREKVFSHLFQTQIYARIELSLKEQAAVVRQKLEASRNQQLGILNSVDADSEQQLEETVADQRQLHVQLADRRREVETSQQQVLEEQALAKKSDADFMRLETEKQRLQILLKQQLDYEGISRNLKAAQAALRVQPAYDRCAQLQGAVTQARDKLALAQLTLAQSEKENRQLQTELDVVLAEEAGVVAEEANLRQLLGYRERVGQLEKVRRALEPRLSLQTQKKHAVQLAIVALEQLKQADRELQQRYLRSLQTLQRIGDVRSEVKRLDGLLASRRTCEIVRLDLQRGEDELKKSNNDRARARLRLDKEQARSDSLEYAWHAGQAALLAQKLTDGQACPVCGSEAHPLPASSSEPVPDEAQRQQAFAEIDAARTSLNGLDSDIVRLESELKNKQASLAGHRDSLADWVDLPVDALETALTESSTRLHALETEQTELNALSSRMQASAEELEQKQVGLSTLEIESAQLSTEVEVARTELRQAERELPERWRAPGRLEAEITVLEAHVEAYGGRKRNCMEAAAKGKLSLHGAETQCQNARRQVVESQVEVETAQQAWQASLRDSPFLDEQAYLDSRLDEAQVSRLQAQFDDYRTQLDQARGAVVSLEKALQDRQRPDLHEISLRVDQVAEAWAIAEQEYLGLDRLLSSLLNAQQKLVKLKQRFQLLEKEYSLVGTLADTATGKTGDRISLQRFVLGVMLDDVLLVASERLKRMSRGRYTLHRQRVKGKGAGASGLELLVDDAYYGTQRAVVTLSGGESFMASLALALALSDVVQARSGGIRLDTLFIDEGFGSLDSESLELAVDTLLELQSGGRMVGVISHVPELKEWIKVRLDVLASRTGSTTRAIVA